MNLSRFFAAIGVFKELFIHTLLYLVGNLLGFIRFHAYHDTNSLSKYLKLALMALVIVFSVPALATHNPSVSHSATAITNGTFSDNYTFISYAQNATPIVIRGNDTQLANLTVWQTFAGVPLASINATGSWRLGGAATPVLFIDNNTGRVGIGTTSPNYLLDVRGGINASSFTGELGWANLTNYPVACPAGQAITTLGDTITCATAGGGAVGWSNTTTVVFNDTAGVSVGIGTAAPQAKLQVNGTTPALQVNDSAYLAVSGGRVGIGTTAPGHTLTVSGNVNITGSGSALLFPDGTSQTTAETNVSLLYVYNSTAWIGMKSTAAGIAQIEVTSAAAPDLICTDCIGTPEIEDVYLLNTGDTATGDYTFDTNTLFIDSANDRVGIGTVAPFAKLMINGTTPALQVNDSVYLAVRGGSVGIGTASPSASLHVAGGSTVNALNVNGTFIINGTTGAVVPGANNTYDLGNDTLRWRNIYGVSIYSGDIILENKFRITEAPNAIEFRNPHGEAIMTLDSEGNLWIKGDIRRF